MTMHHHHHPGRAHPPVTVMPSILRMSVWERLGAMSGIILVLWAVVFWAMS